ncbi:universal stress protein [Streptomyces sp. GMY02]|uniref:universal stress protein n=1 Tax=Streptomyces sp. GMY02 TaxID=1333528 RepID=UPI001C2BDE71|nr:universal stress protein [Streptomyces sp. GMY02]QXE35032.1 universal stress protein [Streptomyces sp. GMY02]
MPERHVVVGTDGSIISTRAQDAAAEEAARRSVPLEIVYAVPDLDAAGPVLATAAARVRAHHPGLTVRLAAVDADPAEALARKGSRAALTVVGTRALGGLAALASRSVARRLMERIHCPLLVVGAGHLPYHTAAGDVLLAIETDADAEATVYADEEAVRRGTRVRFVHTPLYRLPVPPGPCPPAALRAPGGAGLPTGTAAPTREAAGQPDRTAPRLSLDELIAATAEAGVVVIAHHRHGGGGVRHEQTAHALLHRSRCPVLVVPSDLGTRHGGGL